MMAIDHHVGNANDDDDGNIGRHQGLAGGLAGDDQFLFPFLFIPKDTQKHCGQDQIPFLLFSTLPIAGGLAGDDVNPIR